MPDLKPLWTCPRCNAQFVTENMWHSCGTFTLDDLFARCEPHVRMLFDRFAEMIAAVGPATMIPQKTRVVFMTRVRFANVVPRKTHLVCMLGLPRRHDGNPRFEKIETYARGFHGHYFRVAAMEDLDDELAALMREAYEVGEQRPAMDDGSL